MSKNVQTWLVEEKKGNKTTFSETYENYDEAEQMYDYLKTKSENTMVSINKQQKKLLLE